MELQKQRDLEELKRKIHEDKMRKFREQESAKEEQAARKAAGRPKRLSGGNPLLNRFEELSKGSQIEEELRKAEIEERRKRAKPFVPKIPLGKAQSALRKSANKLAKELLGGGGGSNKRGSKNLLKALSRECVKKLSRESVGGGRSRQRLNRSSKSRELVFKCGNSNSRSSLHGSGERLHKLSRSQSAQRLSISGSAESHRRRDKDMKNYLISAVLFDGQENIQASAKNAAEHLQGVEEEEGEGGGREAAADAEIAMRDKMFSAYKAEMEKYLSLFDGGGDAKEKRKKKKGQGRPRGNTKPVIPTVGAMKDKFEALDTDPQAKSAPQKAAVGKLDLAKVRTLAAREESEQADKAKGKSFSAPVVIDKDAFDRTMKQFEHYRESRGHFD